jgi:NTP pyrophosphatase (non-canonical NTP hydrolase)
MLHDGIGCFDPTDETIVNTTISSMLNKFGEDSQIDVSIEEMSELTKELIKYKRSKIHFREKQAASREHVVEEIGDVMFMMEYMKRIFNITDEEIQNTVVQKALRTKERYIDAENR